MKPLYLSVGLMLAAGAAQAQTTVTRQVTTEPVETIVTQGPDGTVITRRPLSTMPVPLTSAPSAAAETIITAPVIGTPGTFEPVTVVPAAPATTIVQAPAATTVGVAAPRPARVTTTARSAKRTASRERSAPVKQKVVTRRPAARATTVGQAIAAPLVLDSAQRQTVYRTIVQGAPATDVVAAPATQTVVTTTPSIVPPILEPLVPPILARPPILSRTEIVTAPAVTYSDPAYAAYAYAPAATATYVVGSRLPAGVALAPVPETIVAAYPATRAYRYAVVGRQVLLVDPATGLVAADLSQ